MHRDSNLNAPFCETITTIFVVAFAAISSAQAQPADASALRAAIAADRFNRLLPSRSDALMEQCPEAPRTTSDRNAPNTSGSIWRFALQPGDRYARDPIDKERVELADRTPLPVGQTGRFQFDLFVPDTASFDSPWTLIGQWHSGTWGPRRGARGAPPLAQVFSNKGLQVRAALKPTGADGPEGLDFRNLYTLQPIPRGRWVKFDYLLQFRRDGTGSIRLALDGAPPVLDYSGPLGDIHLQRVYFKFGIYRRAHTKPVIVCVRNYSQEIVADDVFDDDDSQAHSRQDD